MRKINSRVAAVTAGAATLAVFSGVGGAVAGSLVTSSQIKNDTVRSIDLKNGRGVGEVDLKPGLAAKVNKVGQTGPAGPQGPAGPAGADGKDGVMGSLAASKTFTVADVTNIGGRFADRATTAGSYDLSAGTYLLSTDGFFGSKEATSGKTRMQVAVRGADGSDLGTCFTGAISPLSGREATCNTTRTVVLDQPTTVTVKVFGYADDQGSADSGKMAAYVFASAVKLG